jgi:hypothetical protein
VVHVTPDFYAKGWELYSNRLDKDWGVIDCISFVIMQERNLTEALTSDHHFEQVSKFYCNFGQYSFPLNHSQDSVNRTGTTHTSDW